MEFSAYLYEHIKKHPSVKPQDVIKFCFQAAYGAEHLIEDKKSAEKYFFDEYEKTEPADIPLFEQISRDYCRVNFSAWKNAGYSPYVLFEMFIKTAENSHFNNIEIEEYIKIAENVISKSDVNFSKSDWDLYVENYLCNGISPVHHSEEYRKAEKPSYRIILYEILKNKAIHTRQIDF